MSRLPPSSRGVYQEAPGNNVFTVLLLVALLALMFGTVMLGLEQYTYYGKLMFWVVDQEKAGASAALLDALPAEAVIVFASPAAGGLSRVRTQDPFT
jgi:hypothetical protein